MTPYQLVTSTSPSADVDQGLVYYDQNAQANGTGDHTVHFIQWVTVRGSLQYYFPGLDGRMWLSANVAYLTSPNDGQFGLSQSSTVKYMEWVDVDLMGDITPAVRLGIAYDNYSQHYNDGILAVDHRVEGAAFYMF
jgi:hypothetical protein